MLVIFSLQGRRVRRTRYRRPPWSWRDMTVIVASALVVVAVVGAKLVAPETLYYSPYPPHSLLPPFEPLIGAVLLLLALPAVLAPSSEQPTATDVQPATPNTEHLA